ncbi:MAG: sugar phosphate isomerase/epimerase [Treponema sp.]|jgi:sugar phosphate isomerase/epimerase|nr:sugar phosphate isomerase/epimerase [Treponema sp.]
MRLGGSVLGTYAGAGAFTATARENGFRAVTFPLKYRDGDGEIDRLVNALREADIVIAEVGAWHNNPLSRDQNEKRSALENCKGQLALADYIGARCCVNVAGTHGNRWDGSHPDNFSEEVFAETVETIREIIDAVKPTRTFYAIETMPWMIPNSADAYLRLIRAVDRPAFAAHLDTVNLINSPERYYANSAVTRECFDKFGPQIKSIHIKDIILLPQFTVHLDECPVGKGGYDIPCLLRHAAKLDPDIPVLAEHLQTQGEYKESLVFLNKLLAELNL